ncbi:Putative transposase (Fragment) [Bradyrhizobium vignae]|uniref:Transposase n=1 Tax=Bradyrhizobium vignae TaxID=1549949 RepID=A0A2U3Q9I2_9BRAD
MLKLGELVMILDLHRQGLSVSAIARQLGVDRKTVRAYIAKGLEPPVYKKRAVRPGIVDHFEAYLRERLAAYPALTAVRLWRELKERGFVGGYSIVRDRVRELRPAQPAAFEVRFETPAGEQAQVDFARFEVQFVDEPGVKRIVWLFSMVLGYSRLIWARFVVHQDLQTVLRCHIAALEAIGGAPREILYDRMKTAVLGQDAEGLVVYNRALIPLAIMASSRALAGLIGPRQKARSSGHSATSARTSSSAGSSAIWTTSTASSAIGWIPSPIRGCMPRPIGSSMRPSPRKRRHCKPCRARPTGRCCIWSDGPRTKAW